MFCLTKITCGIKSRNKKRAFANVCEVQLLFYKICPFLIANVKLSTGITYKSSTLEHSGAKVSHCDQATAYSICKIKVIYCKRKF